MKHPIYHVIDTLKHQVKTLEDQKKHLVELYPQYPEGEPFAKSTRKKINILELACFDLETVIEDLTQLPL